MISSELNTIVEISDIPGPGLGARVVDNGFTSFPVNILVYMKVVMKIKSHF